MNLAKPDGIVLSIAEYGRHILPVLQKLYEQNQEDEYLRTLMTHCQKIERAVAKLASNKNASPDVVKTMPKGRGSGKLTSREKEMLTLAAKGKKNAAIARHLGISTITVGKTLSSAYAKLKAKNRAEAVLKLLKE